MTNTKLVLNTPTEFNETGVVQIPEGYQEMKAGEPATTNTLVAFRFEQVQTDHWTTVLGVNHGEPIFFPEQFVYITPKYKIQTNTGNLNDWQNKSVILYNLQARKSGMKSGQGFYVCGFLHKINNDLPEGEAWKVCWGEFLQYGVTFQTISVEETGEVKGEKTICVK